mgnify:FL=1
MASSRCFHGVKDTTWKCIKDKSKEDHGTRYEPDDANEGTSTTPTILGDVVLHFKFDPSSDTVCYDMQKKPFLVSDNQIWDGIQGTVDSCR